MEDKQQNNLIEMSCKLSALGGHWDWSAFPISETAGARRTDPFTHDGRIGYGWWYDRDVEPQFFRDQAERFAKAAKQQIGKRHGRDGKAEEQAQYDQEPEWKKFVGKPGDLAVSWLADLAKKIDVSAPSRKPWFDALLSYAGKIKGAKVQDLDEGVLEKMLTILCT